MTDRTSNEIVAQAISDFDDIREAIRGHKIDVPYPTKTSEYAELIAKIRVGAIMGLSSGSIDVISFEKLFGTAEGSMIGKCLTPIMGKAESVTEY